MAKEYGPMDVLQDKIRKKKSPICLTLAPSAEAVELSGLTLVDFCCEIIDQCHSIIPAVMLHISSFEAFGINGITAISEVRQYAAEKELYTIADARKCEVSENISSVCKLWLSDNGFDSITISGYAGSDGIKPYLDFCLTNSKTIFVYLKTPNATSRELQELVAGDRQVYNVIGDLCVRLGKKTAGQRGFSVIGGLYGLGYDHNAADIRQKYPETFFIIPELQGQGGSPSDCLRLFNSYGHGAMLATRAALCNNLPDEFKTYGEYLAHEIAGLSNRITSYVRIL